MIKYKPNCAVCKEIKVNKKLLNRIFQCSYYVRHSDDSMLKIAADCQGLFSYDSLKNHVKKHQFLNAADYTKAMLRHESAKAETHIIARNLEQLAPSNVWDGVLAKGLEELDNGLMEIKVGDLLKAAKDKSDYNFKKSDQQLQLMESIAHFASGENTENERIYDTRATRKIIDVDTGLPPAAIADWQTQSSDFYQQIAGSTAP